MRSRRGQIIARLDRDQLLAQREREAAGLASSESQLAQAQTSLEWQKATLAADIETAAAPISPSNEARLAELKNGARPQEKLDAKAAVDAAQSELDRAKKDWDRGADAVQERRHLHRAVRSVPQSLRNRRSRC